MEINSVYKVTCVDINHDGLGVVKIDGFPVFVAGMIYNEVAKVKIIKVNKDYGIGEIINLIERSPNRVVPICKNFPECGGCDLLHIKYSEQLKYKKKMVEETLKRIGHIDNYLVDEVIGMDEPYYYRNKVQIPYKNVFNKVQCGYYKRKSHYIIPLDKCYIQTEQTTEMIKFIRNLFNEYKISAYDETTNSGNIRHILVRKTASNEYMIVFITRENKIDNIEEITNKIVQRYKNVKSIVQNINSKNSNVILGDKYNEIYGKDYLIEDILGSKFKLSHKSFFQTNHEQTEKLYKKVIDYLDLKKDDEVIDGYCGVGTMSILVSKKCKRVYGIEIVPEAIEDANENKRLNEIENVSFILGKTEIEIDKLLDKNISALIVDPPRKGCDPSLINAINNSNIKKIVYVSCEASTLARDLSLLSKEYVIKNKTIVDMFPNTVNVECVVCLERR